MSNNYTAATIKFDDGKIVVDSKSYTSKPMADILKQYSGPEAKLELVEKFPSNNINGFAVFSFNPEIVNAVAKQLEMGAMADNYLTKMMGAPYKLQDLVKAIKGDFALVVGDLDMNKVSAFGATPAKVILNIPVGDKTQVNRLMDKLVEGQMMVKVNNEYVLSPMMAGMGYKASVDDKNILFSTDSLTLMQYKTGTAKAGINSEVKNDFKGKPAVMYVNLESILNAMPNSDPEEAAVFTKAKETFKDVKGYSDNFNGKYYAGHFEMRFKNEKENSLTSLLNFANEVGKATAKSRAERKKMESEMLEDSSSFNLSDTLVPPSE
jgi:hypothetical protein